jgi:hypothetical protein
MLPMDERGWRTLADERTAGLRGERRLQPSSWGMRRRLGSVLIAVGIRLAPGELPVAEPAAARGDVQCMAARAWASRTVSSRARAGT